MYIEIEWFFKNFKLKFIFREFEFVFIFVKFFQIFCVFYSVSFFFFWIGGYNKFVYENIWKKKVLYQII